MSKELTLDMIKNQVESGLKEYEVDNNLSIIRYMDFPKFLSILENKRIHMTRADKFEDPLEGYVPDWYIDKELFGIEHFIKDDKAISLLKRRHKERLNKLKEKTFINCWNEGSEESYALWQIYAKQYGVAIKTTVKKLKSYTDGTNAKIYKVKYVDNYDNNIIYPRVDVEDFEINGNFFVCKHSHYKYEKEIRIIAFCENNENYSIPIVDLNELIDEIYVSPFAQNWFLELVSKLIKGQYNLNVPVTKSKIQLNI